jgi:hypothetical protein
MAAASGLGQSVQWDCNKIQIFQAHAMILYERVMNDMNTDRDEAAIERFTRKMTCSSEPSVVAPSCRRQDRLAAQLRVQVLS